MGMPEKPQNGMNIAPDGTVYEVLEDGSIRRIGKVLSNGEFEPFGGPKDGIRVRDGFIYRVINGKEQKIGRILPNGEIESISQRIKSEAEISGNKVKIVAILSVLIAFIIGAGIYLFEEEQEAREQRAREAKIAEEERMKDEEYTNKIKPVYADYLNYLEKSSPKVDKLDSYIKQLNNLLELQDLKYDKNKNRVKEIVSKIEAKKADILLEEKKKADEEIRKALEYKKIISPVYSEYQGKTSPKISDLESYISRLNKIKSALKFDENKQKAADIIRKIEQKKTEVEAANKAEEDRRKQEQEKYLKGRIIGGLIWSDRSSETMNWNAAVNYCKNLTEGGYSNWRLPNIDELRMLVTNNPKTQTGGSCIVSEKNGKLDIENHTENCLGSNEKENFSKFGDKGFFWSSSIITNMGDCCIWTVNFNIGSVGEGGNIVNTIGNQDGRVRCVR